MGIRQYLEDHYLGVGGSLALDRRANLGREVRLVPLRLAECHLVTVGRASGELRQRGLRYQFKDAAMKVIGVGSGSEQGEPPPDCSAAGLRS